MYGCTDRIMEDTELWLKRCKTSVFHPLVLPMIFAEHERKRLFNAMDQKSTDLGERILELKNRVKKKETKKEVEKEATDGERRQTMTQRDCEAIDLWREMSALKNGLETLYGELGSMRDHLHVLQKSQPQIVPDSSGRQGPAPNSETAVHIDAKLKEMMAEFRSKIRRCEGLLGSMTLATQMVLPISHLPYPTYCRIQDLIQSPGVELLHKA